MISDESYLLTGILLIPACYLWKRLYRTYHELEEKHKEAELFSRRHNCVVMYNRLDMTMRGWPPEYKVTLSKNNLHTFLEPHIYFLKTAKSSLSIAMMRIAIPPLFDVLHEAVQRGVKIRIVVNFLSIVTLKERYQKLLKAGVKVAFYIDKSEQLNNIMHCKYILKDYDGDNGYLCMGSMNITSLSAIINNFEDVTFVSAPGALQQFHENFEKCWTMINRDNLQEYNKAVLRDAGFLH